MTKQKFAGWGVLAGCFIMMIFPGGLISNTSSLFMHPICTELGISTTAFSLTFTIGSGVCAFTSAFLVQYLAKGSRTMFKVLMTLGAVFTCGGFALMGLCHELWQFYVVTVLWNLGLNMVTYVPVGMVVNNWFVKNRAMMTGIAFAGGNIGGAVFSAVLSQMIATQGWQASYLFGGGISLVFTVLAVLFLVKRSPAEYGQKPYGDGEAVDEDGQSQGAVWLGLSKREAMKTPAFFMLCVAMLITGIIAAGVATHVVNYLCNGGWEIAVAGLVMTVLPFFGILGNSGGGALLGKIGMKRGVILGVALLVAAMVALIFGQAIPALAFAFAGLFGCAQFLMLVMPSLSVTEIFGSRDYAGIYGITYACYLIGCSVASPVIAIMSETVGYQVAWVVVIAMVVVLAALYFTCFKMSEGFRAKYPE